MRQGLVIKAVSGGFALLNITKIECGNIAQTGRIYNIGSNSFLVYVDEHTGCGQPVAEIRHKTPSGEFITSSRRIGKAADRLLEKHGLQFLQFEYKTFSGTRAKEYSFFNQYGVIYNDNGARVATQDEFLNMSRQEINARLNERFYKKDKVKI